MQPECVTHRGACRLPSFFHRSTFVRTKCKRKGQTGPGTSFRQAGRGARKGQPCWDHGKCGEMAGASPQQAGASSRFAGKCSVCCHENLVPHSTQALLVESDRW
jgi:hypothetical protein